MRKLIKARIEAAKRIQNKFKQYSLRQIVNSLIEKKKTHFEIFCSLKNATRISLCVYLSECKKKVLPFDYCTLRHVFVLFIKKSSVKGKIYKVNFMAEGKSIIDPKYRTDYDDCGNFFNVVDFAKLQEEEDARRKTRTILARFYRDKYKKYLVEYGSMFTKSEAVNKKLMDDYTEEYESSSDEEEILQRSPDQKEKLAKRGSHDFSTRTFFNAILNISPLKQGNKSVMHFNSPRSILKSRSNLKSCVDNKKVSFSKIVTFSS